jgi:Uma2 family endonuclease
MTEATASVCTAAEFTRLRNWKDYELVDGELVPYHCGAEASRICGSLISALHNWGGRRLAWVFSSGTTYCFPHRPQTVRRPWVSVILQHRLRREDIPKVEHMRLAPDLIAEVVTPWHTYEEVEAKVAEYRSAGVKLIWVVSPKSRTVLIRRLDGTCAEVGESGTLSGEDVIPGFACAVAELFV